MSAPTTKFFLLGDDTLQQVVAKRLYIDDLLVSMALELIEYRRIYGPLGCQWLEPTLPADNKPR